MCSCENNEYLFCSKLDKCSSWNRALNYIPMLQHIVDKSVISLHEINFNPTLIPITAEIKEKFYNILMQLSNIYNDVSLYRDKLIIAISIVDYIFRNFSMVRYDYDFIRYSHDIFKRFKSVSFRKVLDKGIENPFFKWEENFDKVVFSLK